jgi:hypothetical protein
MTRDCRAAVDRSPVTERAAQVTKAAKGTFNCEKCSVSRKSPGPVLDEEDLIFIVSDPQVRLKGGKVHPSAVGTVCSGGLSVLRDRARDNEFENTWTELKKNSDAKGKDRYLAGVYTFATSNIRYSAEPRQFGVYDTGLPGRKHHSDIMAIARSNLSNLQRERLCKALVDAMGTNFIDVEDFRMGAFVRHARLLL